MGAVSFARQVISFVVQVVLARLLAPHDYGLAALVMSIGMFAVVFSSAGLSTAIVQCKELKEKVVDALAVITGGLALLLGGGLFLASDKIALFYKEPELAVLLKIVSADIFLKVLLSLYDSLLLRRMRYQALAKIALLGLVVQGAVSIIMAKQGFGAYSLVVGYVSGSFIQLLFYIICTGYVPHSMGDWHGTIPLFKFGLWVLLGRISNQGAITLDQMIIGRVLQVKALGAYNVSANLASILPNTVVGFSGRLMLPVFSRMQDDRARIERGYWRCIRLLMMVAFPLCVVVAIHAREILALLYGNKWTFAYPIMTICAIKAAIASIEGGVTASLFNALGKPRLSAIVLVMSLPLLPGCVLLGSYLGGLEGVAWMMVVNAGIIFGVDQFILWWSFRFRLSNLVKAGLRMAICILPMILAGIFLHGVILRESDTVPALFGGDWFVMLGKCALVALVSSGVYLAMVRLVMREDFAYLWDGLWSVLAKKRR